MPDGHVGSSHVSLRIPNDLIAAFDKLAAALDAAQGEDNRRQG